MRKSRYVTTPIYYVNDIPHIGHAYTTVAADVYARYNRLCGDDVMFLTGTDEHGQKVQEAAAKQNKDPKVYVDEIVVRFKDLWKSLNISNDDFIRTTEERHIKVVQAVLADLYKKGDIYLDTYEGWYCLPDERFWMEKDIEDGKCPDCKRPVEHITESNYFFRMSKYQDWLMEYIAGHPDFILPASRRNEVSGFLQKKLGDLCISRPKSRLSWGIPLPFDDNYVTYVWFDALINYISVPGYLTDMEKFTKWWPADFHLIGKDILTTHSVYWSTMLHAIGIEPPTTIFAHGWWTVGGEKMSKSRGNVVNPVEVINELGELGEFGVDAFRYFLLREVTFGLDGDFSRDAIVRRVNSDLANDLGNLLSRTITMIERYCSGVIPEPSNIGSETSLSVSLTKGHENQRDKNVPPILNSGMDRLGFLTPPEGFSGETDKRLREAVENLYYKIDNFMGRLEYNKALNTIWEVIGLSNRYIDESAPWALAKDETKKDRLASVLYNSAEVLRIITLYIFPYMPGTAEEMWKQLGVNEEITSVNLQDSSRWGRLKPGSRISKGKVLFPRIDTGQLAVSSQKSEVRSKKLEARSQITEEGKNMSETTIPVAETISIDEFAKIKLRVAKILTAENVPNSKKLVKLSVDLGDETRQIVAGIALHYQPEELVGKNVVIVANLKPAKLMGIESQGMVLAASNGEILTLVSPLKDIAPGANVK